MKMCIPLKRAIQSMIVFLMLVAVLLVWPLKVIRPFYYEGELNKESMSLVQNSGTIMQEFTVSGPDISTVSFYIYNEDLIDMEEGILVYRLFDESQNKLDEKQFAVGELEIPGICEIRLRGELETGKRYYFSLENPNAELIFSMSDGVNLDTRYAYRSYFSKAQYAIYALAVLLIGSLFLLGIEKIWKKDEKQVRFDFGVRLGSSILLSGGALWLAVQVFPLCKFTTDWINILFFETGIFLFLAVMLYGLLHRREKSAREEISLQELVKKIPTLLQILAFAGVMGGCVSYVNALYNYGQHTATRTILIYFALAIICGFQKKEILNWYNPVFLVCAVGGSIYYCLQNSGDVQTFTLAKGSAAVFVLWGLVVLNVIRMLILHKQYTWQKLSKTYTLVMMVLLGWMIYNRNTRIWPIEIAFFFGLLAIRMLGTGSASQYLNNFVNGIFVNFICISIYALLYRPFHIFVHTRYAGVFHTVTVAAVYDVMILLLALARFLAAYYKKKTLKAVWKEICIMGMAGAFMLLTLSRTAYLTIIVVGGITLVVTACCEFKDRMAGALKRTVILLGSSVIGFVIVFTGYRLVPAVVGQPYTYDVEWFIDSIYKGEEWDSNRYITVQRFVEVAADKLGIKPEAGSKEAYRQEQLQEAVEKQASEEEIAALTPDVSEKIEEFSNGRIQIFKDYLNNLNWTGHETVAVLDEAGNAIHMHAHNSFIQVAHNFGIGVGLVFLVFCGYVGIKAVKYYVRHLNSDTRMIPAVLAGAFGVSSMVERVFHPYIPLGFAFLFIWMFLIPAEKGEKHEKND